MGEWNSLSTNCIDLETKFDSLLKRPPKNNFSQRNIILKGLCSKNLKNMNPCLSYREKVFKTSGMVTYIGYSNIQRVVHYK